MDNTWATALFFNPFDFGVDIVIEAITKYISGHSDIMMGVVLGNKEDLIVLQRWSKNTGNYGDNTKNSWREYCKSISRF